LENDLETGNLQEQDDDVISPVVNHHSQSVSDLPSIHSGGA